MAILGPSYSHNVTVIGTITSGASVVASTFTDVLGDLNLSGYSMGIAIGDMASFSAPFSPNQSLVDNIISGYNALKDNAFGSTLYNYIEIAPSQTSGDQLGIHLYDSGLGANEGLYIKWSSSQRDDMARIVAEGDSTGARLVFSTNPANTGSQLERLRIDSSGKIWQQVNATTTANYFGWGDGTTTYAQLGGYRDSATTGHLEFYTLKSGALTDVARFDTNGNFGIGVTPSGTYILETNGRTKIAGVVKNSNSITGATTLALINDIVFLTAAAGYTVTLPSPTGVAGKELCLIRTDATAFGITISGHINGTASTNNATWFPASTANRRVVLVTNGTSWYPIVAGTVS